MLKRREAAQEVEDTKADIGWGSQIRSYVLDDQRIKDLRTSVQTSNCDRVLMAIWTCLSKPASRLVSRIRFKVIPMSDNNVQPNVQQDENRLIAERREKLAALRQEGTLSPIRSAAIATREICNRRTEKSKEELEEAGIRVSVAGRVLLNRGAFMVLQDMSGRIQLYVNKEARAFAKSVDLGDIIGVSGVLHKSGKGDLYVDMAEFEMLTKSLRPLPDKHRVCRIWRCATVSATST